jgi:hypothetical protein
LRTSRDDCRKAAPGILFWGEMGQGRAITDEQIEVIKASYVETGSVRAASRAAHVSVATAKKYADTTDDLEQHRTEKRLTVIQVIADSQIKILNAITDPHKLKSAPISELSHAFSSITEKALLMAGQATSITGTTDPSTRLTPDEMELAAKIREKASAQAEA